MVEEADIDDEDCDNNNISTCAVHSDVVEHHGGDGNANGSNGNKRSAMTINPAASEGGNNFATNCVEALPSTSATVPAEEGRGK
jgi:hypothetical protein